MIVKRTISSEILDMAGYYPVVTIIGPRQSGKTTLAKTLFSNKPYVSMENPDELRLAETDPRGFLARFMDGAIIDEVQRAPFLLSYLQEIVDNSARKGLFILISSHQLSLHQSVSQSLAGRTAILKLLPFSIDELEVTFSMEEYLFHGMYPRIYQDHIPPTKFYRDYVQTYVEKDLRQLINVKDLKQFQVFLKLCAGRIGQIFNAKSLSNEVGISHTTINNWLSILEASFLVFRIIPYYENFGKRIVKSPKLYFHDVGLACYLLEINDVKQLERDPLRGNLFENFIVNELVKHQFNHGKEANFYFWRDNNGIEIDLLFRQGSDLCPIEVKSAQTFSTSFTQGLVKFKELSEDRCKQGFIIYTGAQEQKIQWINLINFRNLSTIFS